MKSRTWSALPLSFLLLGLLAGMAHAAFPGANGKIAFTLFQPDGSADVYTVNPDGSGATRLTANPENDGDQSWSPDGRRLAFSSVHGGNVDIYVMNANGTGLTMVPNTSAGGEPAWSPDGSKLAFTSGDQDVWVIGVDGSGATNLTSDGIFNSLPAWSPDGSKIAFVQNPSYPDGNFDVYTMNPDGTGRTPVTTGVGDDYSPNWSPDSAKLAFFRDPVAFASIEDVWSVNPDGSGETQITTDQARSVQPAWSPDGTRITFAKRVGGEFHIFTMNADGTGQVDVTGALGHALVPDWQPVGPNAPPDCSAVRATPASLGAPNHRLITVTISGATDPDGDAVDLEITGVTQDEPQRGPADAVTTTQPNRVRLRAERDPKGDGRVYRIAFEARDVFGGTCTGFATAGVRKGTQAVDSAPPSYDSFGS